MIITSKNNDLIKFVHKLTNKKYRDESGLFIMEGIRSVDDVIGFRKDLIDTLIVTESKSGLYNNAVTVSDNLFSHLCETENGQGVLAIVKKPVPQPVTSDRILFLDGIRDPGNLGTLIRTACAAGYRDVLLRKCADPYSGKAVRSTVSAIVKVNILPAEPETLISLKASGYEVIGSDMNGVSVFGYVAQEKLCVIVGGEADGITEETKRLCDSVLSIPMEGDIESLNAAVSGAIMMYHLKFQQVR